VFALLAFLHVLTFLGPFDTCYELHNGNGYRAGKAKRGERVEQIHAPPELYRQTILMCQIHPSIPSSPVMERICVCRRRGKGDDDKDDDDNGGHDDDEADDADREEGERELRQRN